jgi:hypothetical protein
MAEGKKRGKRPSINPDFRRRSQFPGPEVKEIENSLYGLLSPSLLAPGQRERHRAGDPERLIRMRARLLTLPVLMGVKAIAFVGRGPKNLGARWPFVGSAPQGKPATAAWTLCPRWWWANSLQRGASALRPKELHHLQESFSALLAVMVPPWKSFVKRLKS